MSTFTIAVITIIIALTSLALTATFNLYQRQLQKRIAAKSFLAKINKCLFDAEEDGDKGRQCVCQESYAEFRLSLAGNQAFELEKCWNSYSKAKRNRTRCIESLKCLNRLVHVYTGTLASERIDDCSVCES